MNKQELIDYCNALKESKNRIINCIDVDGIIDKIKQLDKPETVKVKQFVADWYEENKDSFEFNVWDWIAFRDEVKKIENREFNNWINDSRENPIQILVNMHQFGYEIEKEKQYLVKIKATKHYLVKDGNGKIFFSLAFKGYFTKKELEEAGFGWVFDCPGIEIEEVEV